nr:hypothetical protein [Tanacetum cinerariifolium]
MATTIDQQVALDESFVPSSAFQVTADVPEIYMEEFWAMAKLHHTSIHFKMDTKKSILKLEAFREMLHISPRIPSQSFAELPIEEEILEFLRQETKISQQRGFGTDEGTGSRPGVSDVPSDDLEEELSWNSSDDEDVGGQDEGDKNDESDDGKTRLEEEESFDPIPRTPEGSKNERNDEEDQELRLSEEARIQEEEEADELYRDVNINQGRGLQVTQNVKDSHVTLTLVNPDGPQESSSMSSFVTSMLNPTSDVRVESIFTTTSSPIVSLQTPTPIMTPFTIATITT